MSVTSMNDSKETLSCDSISEIFSCDSISDSFISSDKYLGNKEQICTAQMQDSSTDLQWCTELCTELDYNYVRKGVTNWNKMLFTKNDSTISNMRTTGTQIPVHFMDKEVQTSVLNNDTNTRQKYLFRQDMKTNHNTQESSSSGSSKENNKSVYVYYPNYSLPDLSFLQGVFEMGNIDDGPQTIHLSPTKHKVPNTNYTGVKLRQNTARKSQIRPKSYTDYETLSNQNFNHIKDWDSLHTLLPNELKTIIEKTQNVVNSRDNINTRTKYDSPLNEKSNINVRMRPHKNKPQKSRFGDTHGGHHYTSRSNKRYSLQEPFSGSSKQKHKQNMGSCMNRSITMPNCHACHCIQHCYNCCHSCCHSSCHSPTTPTNKPKNQIENSDINSSIDKLCQILAMDLSFKKIMNIVNNNSQSGQTYKPCNNSTQFNGYINESVKDGTNFKELRQHWESLATSPGSSTNCLTPKRESFNVSYQPINKLKINDNQTKPITSKKPILETKKPLSYMTRPTTLYMGNPFIQRKSLIPISKASQAKSPTYCAMKTKSVSAAYK